ISGLGIQISLEHSLEELGEKIEIFSQEYSNNRISRFDFDAKMKELDSKLNQILIERNEWSKQVDALITNVSSNTSLSDSNTLAQYIQNRYLDRMESSREAVLELCISITEFK
uniref:complement regulator-acquiring protein n=1 Tax=Borreliella bavariensis TaxID=664662 RepID=UPI00165E376B